MPLNIKFPFQFDAKGHTASTGDDDHIRDMIEEVLLTSPGERVNRPDFGSGLLQLVFAPNSPELAAALQFTLQSALDRWLGDLIAVRKLSVEAVDSTLTIAVDYVVRQSGASHHHTFTRETS